MNNRFFSIWNVDNTPCSTGLQQNTASALACLFGIVFVFAEYQNRFVRYCAVQSLFAGAIWMLVFIALSVLSLTPLLGAVFLLARALFTLLMMVAVGVMAYLAYKGKKVVLPWVSKYAENWSAPDE
ncbi:MAG: hypothetical protein JXR76_12160 [Deltaproteobacteria bacterium]|nr:hypothetical protein [Deltaproteobacteria bacterium]